jgi:hypothetical protein
MKLACCVSGLWLLLLIGCATGTSSTVEMHVGIVNRSSKEIENPVVRFGANECRWDSLAKNSTRVKLFYRYPITGQAELQWDATGEHRSEKFDLSRTYPAGRPGQLTFTVYDERAEVKFKEKTP